MDRTILLVKGNPDHEMLTLRALKKPGCHLLLWFTMEPRRWISFSRGAYAGRDPSQTPQTVLLDLKLPKVDRPAVLLRIRQ